MGIEKPKNLERTNLTIVKMNNNENVPNVELKIKKYLLPHNNQFEAGAKLEYK